jgi:hypothetical protein
VGWFDRLKFLSFCWHYFLFFLRVSRVGVGNNERAVGSNLLGSSDFFCACVFAVIRFAPAPSPPIFWTTPSLTTAKVVK